jgi:hypothetical protein
VWRRRRPARRRNQCRRGRRGAGGAPAHGAAGVGRSTTEFRGFAECLGHSAKPRLHSAKALPSVTLGKGYSVKISSAKTSLPSAFCRALGKGFAECQKALGKEKHSAKCKSEKNSNDETGNKNLIGEACTAS